MEKRWLGGFQEPGWVVLLLHMNSQSSTYFCVWSAIIFRLEAFRLLVLENGSYHRLQDHCCVSVSPLASCCKQNRFQKTFLALHGLPWTYLPLFKFYMPQDIGDVLRVRGMVPSPQLCGTIFHQWSNVLKNIFIFLCFYLQTNALAFFTCALSSLFCLIHPFVLLTFLNTVAGSVSYFFSTHLCFTTMWINCTTLCQLVLFEKSSVIKTDLGTTLQ